MARLEEARNKRTVATSSREPDLGVVAFATLDPLIRASNRLLEGWMAVSSEMLEFGKARFERGFEMSKALAQSTSLNEALDLQATYTRSLVNDYVSEAQKIADLGTRSVIDSFSTLKQQTRDQHTGDTAYHAEAAE